MTQKKNIRDKVMYTLIPPLKKGDFSNSKNKHSSKYQDTTWTRNKYTE